MYRCIVFFLYSFVALITLNLFYFFYYCTVLSALTAKLPVWGEQRAILSHLNFIMDHNNHHPHHHPHHHHQCHHHDDDEDDDGEGDDYVSPPLSQELPDGGLVEPLLPVEELSDRFSSGFQELAAQHVVNTLHTNTHTSYKDIHIHTQTRTYRYTHTSGCFSSEERD